MKIVWTIVLVSIVITGHALAWGNRGHEVVAFIAYQHLDAATKAQVDSLVKLNPCFKKWKTVVASLPAEEQSAGLFMLAATWPDRIKLPAYDCQPGHKFIFDGAKGPGTTGSQNVPPAVPQASQNVGYSDQRRHRYWHFIDTPFSPDDTPVSPPFIPNALTQLMLLIKAIESNEPAALKSYDMVWIEHLVGDVHQPLHDAERFTVNHPHGDQGGNLLMICNTTNCTQELHAYWDGIPGKTDDLAAAIAMGKTINAQPPSTDEQINVENPAGWITEGFLLAKTTVYAPPISSDGAGSVPAPPDAAYADAAKKVAATQLFMAGQRLAQILNNYLT